MKRILVAESQGFPREACELLSRVGKVALEDLDRCGLETALAGTHVLWTRLRHKVDVALLDCAPSLEWIATPTTGLTHVDTEEVSRRKIRLVSLRGETAFLDNIRATAEHTLALILSLLRHIPAATAHVTAGGWSRDMFQGSELFGKTVGVVGYGRLGKIVARYVAAFEARVIACDPHPAGPIAPNVEMLPLDALLREADIVTLHVNSCAETRGFFGPGQFAQMKPGSRLINTSRGELVDETALLNALRCGRIAGAAVDVLSNEDAAGMSEHPLVRYAGEHGNLLVTPHIGGCTAESMEKTEVFLARKLCGQMEEEMTRVLQPA